MTIARNYFRDILSAKINTLESYWEVVQPLDARLADAESQLVVIATPKSTYEDKKLAVEQLQVFCSINIVIPVCIFILFRLSMMPSEHSNPRLNRSNRYQCLLMNLVYGKILTMSRNVTAPLWQLFR